MEKKEIIGQRIRELRLKNGYEQMDIALKLGYKSDTTISKWESGASLPTGKKLPLLALMLNTSTDYILFGETPTTPPNAKNATIQAINDTAVQLHPERQENVLEYATEQLEEQKKTTREIQEEVAGYKSDKIIAFPDKEEFEYGTFSLRGLGSAGDGILQEDDEDIEVRLPLNEVPDDFDDLVLVIGDSMRPKLHNGDILFIQHTKQIEIGQIGIFRTNKGNFIKRFQQDRLESLNPDYEDVYFAEDEYAEAIGVVEDIYRK